MFDFPDKFLMFVKGILFLGKIMIGYEAASFSSQTCDLLSKAIRFLSKNKTLTAKLSLYLFLKYMPSLSKATFSISIKNSNTLK